MIRTYNSYKHEKMTSKLETSVLWNAHDAQRTQLKYCFSNGRGPLCIVRKLCIQQYDQNAKLNPVFLNPYDLQLKKKSRLR